MEIFITPEMVCHYLESKGWRIFSDWQKRILYYEHEAAKRNIKVPVCLKFKNFQEKMDACIEKIAVISETTQDNIRGEILQADAQKKKREEKAKRAKKEVTKEMLFHFLKRYNWKLIAEEQNSRWRKYEHVNYINIITVYLIKDHSRTIRELAEIYDTTIEAMKDQIIRKWEIAHQTEEPEETLRISQTPRDENGERIPAIALPEPFTVDQITDLLLPYIPTLEDEKAAEEGIFIITPEMIIRYLYGQGWSFHESLNDSFVLTKKGAIDETGRAPIIVVPVDSQDESYGTMFTSCLKTLSIVNNTTVEKVRHEIFNYVHPFKKLEQENKAARPVVTIQHTEHGLAKATNLLDITPQMVDRYLCSLGWKKVDICRHITEDKPVDIVYEKDGREDHLYLPSEKNDKEYGYGLKLCLIRLAECEGINVDQLRIQIGLHWFKTQQDKSINNDDADVTFDIYLDRCYRARKRDREMFANGTEEDREEEESEEAAAYGTTKATEAKLKAVVDEIIEKQIEPNVQRDERCLFVKGNTVHAKNSGIRSEDIRRHRTLINSYLPRILDMLYFEATERNNVQVMMWLADKIIPNSKPATFTDVASVAKIKTMAELRDQSAHTINETLKGDATLEEAKQLMDLYGNHKSLIEASDIEAKLEPMAQILAERFGKK
jgi:hypothetical protein